MTKQDREEAAAARRLSEALDEARELLARVDRGERAGYELWRSLCWVRAALGRLRRARGWT